MKNIKTYLLAGVTALTLSSCNDFLSTLPKDAMSPSTLLTTTSLGRDSPTLAMVLCPLLIPDGRSITSLSLVVATPFWIILISATLVMKL